MVLYFYFIFLFHFFISFFVAKSVITACFYETDFIRSSILSVGSDNEMNLTDYERGR